MYKVHRYIFVSEEYSKVEGETLSKTFSQIQEWYSMLLTLLLRVAQGHQEILISLFNAYMSKKDRSTY